MDKTNMNTDTEQELDSEQDIDQVFFAVLV